MNIEIGHCLWSLTDVVVKDSSNYIKYIINRC